MLIHEVCVKTDLTKKAVEYYIEQRLICPAALENGYRDFNEADVERLKKIAVLRKLGLSALDIHAALSDETGEALRNIAVRKGLEAQREQAKKRLLGRLSAGKIDFSGLKAQLDALEKGATIAEKLLIAFPGYFGRFIFARFLNEPIVSDEQKSAYREIVAFLDGVPELIFPDDIEAFWSEATDALGAEEIGAVLEGSKRALEDIEGFLQEHKTTLEDYFAFKRSEEYTSSAAGRLQALMKDFCGSSGYYDTFIPAMKRLSAPYVQYLEQMEAANEKLLARYPEAAMD